uniref:Adenylate kinase isoenzyme 6 homolog n=1 Tax=Syphacia muris TaxID=451379 RepID=A0A0N5AMD9_9BILA
MATAETRQKPNILITGSPGTGKTTLGRALVEKIGYDFIECGKEISEHELYNGYDDELECYILDEDKLLDHIEGRLDSTKGGCIVDYHGCDFFPERWFDFVIVLRCNNTLLYDRLKSRGYNDRKIRENVECEIFGSLLEEAKDAYKQEIVYEMDSETPAQMNFNVEKIAQLVQSWKH